MPTSGSALFFYGLQMNVYFDESGDLGWKLDKPFGNGGSSRYLTIAFLIIPVNKQHLTKRIVKKTYKFEKRKTKIELKGKDLTKRGIIFFSSEIVNLLQKNKDIKIIIITVKKENVLHHIRQDSNKLYNYMINLALLDEIKNQPIVTLIPDPRSIKVESKNSMLGYLKIKLWFEKSSSTIIKEIFQESRKNLNLQFIDFIAHYKKLGKRSNYFTHSTGFKIKYYLF